MTVYNSITMKRVLKMLFFFIIICSSSGCDRISLRIRMREFQSQKVIFPSTMECVYGVEECHTELFEPKTRLVVYIDSLNCSSCGINRLSRFAKYAALAKSNQDFQFLVVIWPNYEAKGDISKNIEHWHFPFDVFLDYEGVFSKSNPKLPRIDARFHTFLLNKHNQPVMIGDPTSSKRIESLFKELYHKELHNVNLN